MNAFSLLNQALGVYLIGAVLALLFCANRPASGAIAGAGCALASALTAAAGFSALLAAPQFHTLHADIPWLQVGVQLTGIRAVWLIATGLPACFIGLFTIAWSRHPQAKSHGPLMNLLMAAAVVAIAADNLGWLVVMAEIMALCAAFLTGCVQSGKLWFVLGRLGRCCWRLLAGRRGSFTARWTLR